MKEIKCLSTRGLTLAHCRLCVHRAVYLQVLNCAYGPLNCTVEFFVVKNSPSCKVIELSSGEDVSEIVLVSQMIFVKKMKLCEGQKSIF